MDIQEHRMQCLRMAFELGGNPEAVILAAEKLLQFVAGPQTIVPAATVSVAIEETVLVAASTDEQAIDQSLPHANEPSVAAVVADPIAACGTLMTMAPSGHLADATPAVEVPLAVAEASPSDADPVEAAIATPIASEVDIATVTDDAAGDLPPVETSVDTSETTSLHSALVADVISTSESLPVTLEIVTKQPAQQLAESENGFDKPHLDSELTERTSGSVEEGQSSVQAVTAH